MDLFWLFGLCVWLSNNMSTSTASGCLQALLQCVNLCLRVSRCALYVFCDFSCFFMAYKEPVHPCLRLSASLIHLPHSLLLPLKQTPTHTHAQTHAQTHTRLHIQTHTNMCTYTRAPADAYRHIHAHSNAGTDAYTHSNVYSDA